MALGIDSLETLCMSESTSYHVAVLGIVLGTPAKQADTRVYAPAGQAGAVKSFTSCMSIGTQRMNTLLFLSCLLASDISLAH